MTLEELLFLLAPVIIIGPIIYLIFKNSDSEQLSIVHPRSTDKKGGQHRLYMALIAIGLLSVTFVLKGGVTQPIPAVFKIIGLVALIFAVLFIMRKNK